ncbi:hypothetical protein M9H77_27987 [Catharanthus roseus]|uniref:Uncharacterized protein n=1 Tax=Catharanthus roseus TaxID=4058 RepID=A0ACC0AEY6_CATRO|nr:hypothetical protein M9H77_27987 [Catharanthus roseus]
MSKRFSCELFLEEKTGPLQICLPGLCVKRKPAAYGGSQQEIGAWLLQVKVSGLGQEKKCVAAVGPSAAAQHLKRLMPRQERIVGPDQEKEAGLVQEKWHVAAAIGPSAVGQYWKKMVCGLLQMVQKAQSDYCPWFLHWVWRNEFHCSGERLGMPTGALADAEAAIPSRSSVPSGSVPPRLLL